MTIATAKQRSTAFYEWQHRAQGHQLWNFPVELEPPYRPFDICRVPLLPSVDDGRKNSFFGFIAKRFKRSFNNGDALLASNGCDSDLLPSELVDNLPLSTIAVSFSPDDKLQSEHITQFLLNLSYCDSQIGFEVVGTSKMINIQFVSRKSEMPYLKQQLLAYFPNVFLVEGKDLLAQLTNIGAETAVVDFALSQEFIRPLRVQSAPDFLISIVSTMESLQEGETAILQVLFKGAKEAWAESILKSVTDADGKSFFADAPEMVQLAREKVSSLLFGTVIRIVAQTPFSERTKDIAKMLAGGIMAAARSESNELIPVSNTGYNDNEHWEDVLRRKTRRSPMLLNGEELAVFVHPPASSIISHRLQRSSHKSKAAPGEVVGHQLVLGENLYRNARTTVTLNLEQRLRHIYIIGATGTGKTTLILNLVRQNAERGETCAILDPHGDLIDRIMENIPANRLDDVIVFDPSDAECPVGFNILHARSEVEKNVISSDLVAIFRRFSTSWGDQMTTVLGNAISAMLESPRPMTLIDLRYFLGDGAFRKSVLETVTDPQIRYFWEREFPLLKGNSESSILTRLDSFLRPKLIRNIIEQQEGLDFAEIVDTKKILLIKLTQGIIGEENAHLLGSLLISKLHQIIMARQMKKESDREPFFLYLDEFQNFVTPSMAAILSGGRKFKLGLVCAHQDLQTLASSDSSLANSIITNAGTRICFRLGDFDARKLEEGFRHFDASDLMNLGVGEAIVRVERNEYDFNIRTYEPLNVSQDEAKRKRETIIAHSRQKYGKQIIEVTKPNEVPPVVEAKPPVERQVILTKHPLPIVERIPEIRTKPKIDLVADEVSRYDTSRHTYLKTLIKKMAEQRGYRAVVEESVPEGGRVDVSLERNKKKIAVEISVTTRDTWELHNITKCLNAGFDSVVVCSTEKKTLTTLKVLIAQKLTTTEQNKVHLFSPDELFAFLDQQTIPQAVPEQRIKGYRVRVSYDSVAEAEGKNKREAIVQVVSQALRRLKKENSN